MNKNEVKFYIMIINHGKKVMSMNKSITTRTRYSIVGSDYSSPRGE